MLKYATIIGLLTLTPLALAADMEHILAIQQALIMRQQQQIEQLKPVYLSDLDIQVTNAHNWKKDGVTWLPESGFRLADSTIYTKGLQIHPPNEGIARVEVRVPQNHALFSTILADITSCGSSEYIYRFSTKKGSMVTLVGTFSKQSKTRVELGVAQVDSLIIEVDSAGSHGCDHAALVDAKFIN